MNPSLTLPRFARSKLGLEAKDTRETVPVIPSPTVPVVPSPKAVSSLLTPRMIPSVPTPTRTPAVAIVNGLAVIPSPVASPIRSPAIQVEPRSPLYTPRIGVIKGGPMSPKPTLQPDENPWLPPKIEGAGELKIAAITPIGTVAMVPTCDKRPPATPRRLPPTPTRHLTLRVVDEHTGAMKIDPILTAAIYLDCTKPEDQDYNHVAERMRTIAVTTTTLHKQYTTTFRPLPNVSGRVPAVTFENALAVYENNQVYYQDRIDDRTLTTEAIKDGLNALEQWFGNIIEPKPRDDDDIEAWRDRESMKLTKGVTAYCDPELYQYLKPFDAATRAQIQKLQ